MRRPLPLLFLIAATLTAGCSGEDKPANASRANSPDHMVETALVRSEEIAATATRTGSLRAQREIQILSQEEGRIVALPYFAGDAVRQGDLLLQLDDTLLTAELRKSEAQRRQMELDLGRLERLSRNHLISDEELARARTALDIALAEEQLLRTRLGYTRISAPFAGVISERRAEPGDIVPKFTHVLTLTDLDSLVTTTSVSELLLPFLAVGDAVSIHIDALGTAPHPGRILRIHPSIDASTRQGVVEVALDPVPAAARPGQLCRILFTGHPQVRRVIPFSALRRDNSGEFVFTLDADDKVQRHAVVSGMHLGEDIELLSGPDTGTRVVTKGFLGLLPGRKVKSVNAMPATS
ncbi:efflux RND transporter periplasmic adaptor subunit [Sulfurivermis fontis]|jgi:membrane fusion protein (multidrug efflux system)|uniref:efflux RND transporter periplasmic adaptor subunit n=1 Tax=Sulfurivermis fontis TaxID=1972068 RepID=UPI001559276D|nr:efflux RND transporter periplasmic adaptor subunit [Sulfurivermis fontis]